jgi:hypothetical protein
MGFLYNGNYLEITGGTFSMTTEDGKHGIFNGEGTEATMVITGGTFTTLGDGAETITNEGIATITGGTFIAKGVGSVAMLSGGDATITGGTFIAEGDSDHGLTWWWQDDEYHLYYNSRSAAILVEGGEGGTKINGGIFISNGEHSSPVLVEEGVLQITGGTFTTDAYHSYAVYIGKNSAVEIIGGTFTATGADSVALYNNNTFGTTVIRSGTFSVSTAETNSYAVYAGEGIYCCAPEPANLLIYRPSTVTSGKINDESRIDWRES